MENGGNTSSSRIHNGSWDIWQYNCNGGTCRNILFTPAAAETASTTAQPPAGGAGHALPFPTHNSEHYFDPHHRQQRNSIYGGGGEEAPHHRYYPDPHLMCLELGKRQYHLDDSNYSCSVIDRPVHVEGFSININGKRGKLYDHCYGGTSGGSFSTAPSSSTAVAIPRCQVEGCNAGLAAAKDYHRRHKVCEMHSKAPKVIVLGLEQRFCQQCSRFHGVSEFDDAKRSCRRRLAGHNERRRKSSHESISKNYSQGCAFSLLSSKSVSWDSPADLSSRSSAALRELIAEHRAATLGRQRILEQNLHHHHVIEHLGDQCQPAAGSSFFLPPPPASNV